MKNESHNSTTVPAADMEQNPSHEPMGAKETPRFNSPVHITIISYRKLNHDPDGISAKAAIDGIVHAGILSDDSAKQVKKVTFESRKDANERTEIIIETI